MIITNLACQNCRTKIEGEFLPCKFCRLPSEQVEFIEVFLKCRGSIKDVEKELGISYPTVRNRLDNVLHSLGYKVDKVDNSEDIKRQDILASLEKGEITPEEAAQQLRKAKKQ